LLVYPGPSYAPPLFQESRVWPVRLFSEARCSTLPSRGRHTASRVSPLMSNVRRQMKQLWTSVVVLLGLVSPALSRASDFVEYQGHRVSVARRYANFDDFKSDPNNLTDLQAKQASNLVRKAKFGPRFKDSAALLAALEELQFPGYGYFFANQVGAKIDPKLEISFVELPKAGENRYLITEVQPDGSYLVVEDFIAPSEPEITRVKRGPGAQLQYRGAGEKPIVPRKRGA
jgi:hypothetical protein